MKHKIRHFYLKTIFFSAIMILTACASEAPLQQAEHLAARQASRIRQHLPIKSGPYTWVQAQNKGAVITITLINPDASAAQAETFARNFPQRMCEQATVMDLLEKGVDYQITINPESSNAQQIILDAQTCSAVHA